MRTVDRGGAPGRAAVMKRFTNIPIQVKAGTRDVAVTFVERARVESDEFVGVLPGDLFSRGDRMPRLVDGVQVVGPFNSPGVSDTPSRRRVFICRPTQTATPNEEQTCAQRIADEPRAPSVPSPGDRSGSRIAHTVLRERPEGQGRIRCWDRAADCSRACQPRVSLSRGSRTRRAPPDSQSSRSPTSSWPRGSRSSSGVRGPMMRCSTSPPPAN